MDWKLQTVIKLFKKSVHKNQLKSFRVESMFSINLFFRSVSECSEKYIFHYGNKCSFNWLNLWRSHAVRNLFSLGLSQLGTLFGDGLSKFNIPFSKLSKKSEFLDLNFFNSDSCKLLFNKLCLTLKYGMIEEFFALKIDLLTGINFER